MKRLISFFFIKIIKVFTNLCLYLFILPKNLYTNIMSIQINFNMFSGFLYQSMKGLTILYNIVRFLFLLFVIYRLFFYIVESIYPGHFSDFIIDNFFFQYMKIFSLLSIDLPEEPSKRLGYYNMFYFMDLMSLRSMLPEYYIYYRADDSHHLLLWKLECLIMERYVEFKKHSSYSNENCGFNYINVHRYYRIAFNNLLSDRADISFNKWNTNIPLNKTLNLSNGKKLLGIVLITFYFLKDLFVLYFYYVPIITIHDSSMTILYYIFSFFNYNIYTDVWNADNFKYFILSYIIYDFFIFSYIMICISAFYFINFFLVLFLSTIGTLLLSKNIDNISNNELKKICKNRILYHKYHAKVIQKKFSTAKSIAYFQEALNNDLNYIKFYIKKDGKSKIIIHDLYLKFSEEALFNDPDLEENIWLIYLKIKCDFIIYKIQITDFVYIVSGIKEFFFKIIFYVKDSKEFESKVNLIISTNKKNMKKKRRYYYYCTIRFIDRLINKKKKNLYFFLSCLFTIYLLFIYYF